MGVKSAFGLRGVEALPELTLTGGAHFRRWRKRYGARVNDVRLRLPALRRAVDVRIISRRLPRRRH
jgi:hypothetical protein